MKQNTVSKADLKNRRKYIRITTTLPVTFYLIDEKGKQITPWLQGFTHDISKGGIGLLINDLWQGLWERINQRGTVLMLAIEMPFKKKRILAKGKIAWTSSKALGEFTQHTLGVEFTEITPKHAAALFRFALIKKRLPLVVSALFIVIVAVSVGLFLKTNELVLENRRIVKNYVNVIGQSSDLEALLAQENKKRDSLLRRQKDVQEKIEGLETQVGIYQQQYSQLQREARKDEISRQKELAVLQNQITQLNKGLEASRKETEFLRKKEQERLAAAKKIQNQVKELKKERLASSQKVLEGMYSWIKSRQDQVRGCGGWGRLR